MSLYARHLPASHPVLQRARERNLSMQDIREATGGSLDELSADRRADITAQIEDMARDLVRIPDVPLTQQQMRLMGAIAKECWRRVAVRTVEG